VRGRRWRQTRGETVPSSGRRGSAERFKEGLLPGGKEGGDRLRLVQQEKEERRAILVGERWSLLLMGERGPDSMVGGLLTSFVREKGCNDA